MECGAKKFVLLPGESAIAHIKLKFLRFCMSYKTILTINNVRFHESLEVKNLFDQMGNH